jgi:hypothetical protein
MLEMPWLDRLPNGTPEGANVLANRLYWSLRLAEGHGRWVVYAGEDVLLRTDSRETAEAFLYGLGLAYGAIPREAFLRLESDLKQLIDP